MCSLPAPSPALSSAVPRTPPTHFRSRLQLPIGANRLFPPKYRSGGGKVLISGLGVDLSFILGNLGLVNFLKHSFLHSNLG